MEEHLKGMLSKEDLSRFPYRAASSHAQGGYRSDYNSPRMASITIPEASNGVYCS
jgi:hypothetical protein